MPESVTVAPISSEAVVLLSEMSFAPLYTVTGTDAVKPPSWVLTVRTALPTETPVTTPFASTVNTELLPEVQISFLLPAFSGSTFAKTVVLAVSATLTADTGKVTPVTGTETLTVHFAVFLPSAVVAVITACPPETALITPAAETVATFVFELVQITFLFEAFAGRTVALSVPVWPALRFIALTLSSTDFVCLRTLTVQTAFFPPSTAFAVMVAVPTETAFTTPFLLTVATLVFEELHLTALFNALFGRTVALSVLDAPS